jgi:N-acetyl-beta-hexosaminidase
MALDGIWLFNLWANLKLFKDLCIVREAALARFSYGNWFWYLVRFKAKLFQVVGFKLEEVHEVINNDCFK